MAKNLRRTLNNFRISELNSKLEFLERAIENKNVN